MLATEAATPETTGRACGLRWYPPPTIQPAAGRIHTHMKTATSSAVLPCTPDTFWSAFLDESVLRALYVDELQSRTFDLLELSDSTRTLRIEPAGPNQCRRTDTWTIEAKVFGLGGLLESTIHKELQSGREKEYAFLTRWLNSSAAPT